MAVKMIALAWLFLGLLSMLGQTIPNSIDDGTPTITYAQPAPPVHIQSQALFAANSGTESYSPLSHSIASLEVPVTLIPVGQNEGVIHLKLVWLDPDWFESDTPKESPTPLYLGLRSYLRGAH